MKKILVINDKEKFLSKITCKLFHGRLLGYCSGIEVEKIIDSEKPDYIMLGLPDYVLDEIKPVDGNDLVSMLSHIDGNIRLRVAIFNIKFPKMKSLHLWHLFQFPHTEKSR